MWPPIHVGWQNGQTIQSNKPYLLDFPDSPEEECEGHIIPSLTHSSLVSFGKIYDAGSTYEFKAWEVTNKRKGKIIIQGPRDRINGLWKIPLTAKLRAPPTQTHREKNNHSHQSSSLPDLIQYLHDANFSPVPSTWIEAIENGFLQ